MLTPCHRDYINEILNYISGTTNINYQKNVKTILKAYYNQINKEYDMPGHFGGDDKNDGWVKDDAIFYQIYSPTNITKSFKKDIKNKFDNDLKELLKIICEENKWGGILKEFIFIVNTFDNELPHDSEGFYEKETKFLMDKYNITFKYKIVSGKDYLRDILQGIKDLETLKNISSELRIYHSIIKDTITSADIYDLIVSISGNLNKKYLNPNEKDIDYYKRRSTAKKIIINNLSENEEQINIIMENLDVVEKAIRNINQDTISSDKFEDVKNYIILLYKQLSEEYNGIELLDILCKKTSEKANKDNQEIAIKHLIIYIFDKCDIFEKEKKELNNNDNAK